MKKRLCKSVSPVYKVAIWPAAAMSFGLAAAPVLAQPSAQQREEIIVSARRQQESVQEIPISVSVFSQEVLTQNNVVSGVDLALYTPSLAVNQRFGPDQASFAIRGFTQELRTTASVGFYFAEVVAPRGGGSVTAGDGAGPGAFFDLQDVLVLKGPQGTLFGRNTTGGAVLITPQEPTNQLEGYLEGSAGNYDMQRIQGVINIPISDNVRTRLGIDTMQREGHLKSTSGVGPGNLGDTDYIAARASVMWDVTDSVENYTILSYTHSDNNGVVSGLFQCKPGLAIYNMGCAAQLAHQSEDFYALEQSMESPSSELKQWQVINTTTWSVNDDLSIKNILSYADLEQNTGTDIYGVNYDYYGLGTYGFVNGVQGFSYPSNSQISFVEELQFQGYGLNGDLTWQAGLYFENSKPDGASGTYALNSLYCSSYDAVNPANNTCIDPARNFYYQQFGFDLIGGIFGPGGNGGSSTQIGEIEYTNQAAYSEITYEISEQWKVTGGLRYTQDKVVGQAKARIWNGYPYQSAPGVPATPDVASISRCIYSTASLSNGCKDDLDQTSEAVTGLIDADFFPSDDVMLYAKYSRGYRMGSVNLFGGEGYREYNPEHVDAYELGAKMAFGGVVPGTFNIAVFYNDIQDQQLQFGHLAPGVTPTTDIVNAGSSVIQGAEAEASLMLLEGLVLNATYTYLDTELKEVDSIVGTGGVRIVPSATAGADLTFSPMHSAVTNLNYQLPLPVEIGEMSLGITYSYTGAQNSSSPTSSPYARLDSYEVFNLSANWMGIFGSGFDASLFMTNALDEEYTTYVPALYNSMGFETRMVGTPKMWGARLRYSFGQ